MHHTLCRSPVSAGANPIAGQGERQRCSALDRSAHDGLESEQGSYGSSETKRYGVPRAADASDNRLAFVSFALLILVIGPLITGALINVNERELLDAVKLAQSQVQTMRSVVQEQRVGASYPRLAAQQRQLDTALAAAIMQQDRAKQRISNLHDIQDAVIAAFGFLGLVAAFYSIRALHYTRENQKQLRELAAANSRRVRALESLFETAGRAVRQRVSAGDARSHDRARGACPAGR